MRLNVMQNDDGITTGFEVPNILLSRGNAALLIERVQATFAAAWG